MGVEMTEALYLIDWHAKNKQIHRRDIKDKDYVGLPFQRTASAAGQYTNSLETEFGKIVIFP